jgi:nucleotide-binding universal stress UspA family protein
MDYKTIMVNLDIDDPVGERLGLACELAQRFDADLIGFVACEPYPDLPALHGRVVNNGLLRHRIAEIEGRLKTAKEAFEARTAGRASWRGIVGDPTRLLVEHSRAADLIVVGSPRDGFAKDPYRYIDVETPLLSSGRPILIASESVDPLKAETVLVAWKDSREARRAVVDAIPFLVHARDVLVATIDEGDPNNARDSASDVVRLLTKHGVTARSEVTKAGNRHIGEALAEIARGISADLIVSGSYGHTRLHEWAFGGVTRSLLKQGSVNRLFSN